MILRCLLSVAGCALALACLPARSDPAPFDLPGPTLQLKVTRGGVTLPAARVPNLAAGDRLSLKPDLPKEQSEHYLMVAAFLRGATNPPPADWFVRCDTWVPKCAQQGLTLTVPKEAQQLLVFLAPETGGDFKTLMDAVRGRPGAFVRTSQDLNQATLDRSRLESYLAAIRTLADTEPARLKEVAPLLARSLAIKVDEKCLDKMATVQASCLTQGRETLILNDGHSASLAQALTSGPASDLAMDASNTAQLKYGYYGPYIGSLFDIARLLDSFHTAHYQYIPALAPSSEDRLSLLLNAAPSFHDPKSVLVMALPAIEHAQLPPLHVVEPKEVLCARKSPFVLQVEGAPLVFSTGFAHQMVLKVPLTDGRTLTLPARADAERGGFVVDAGALKNVAAGTTGRATLAGFWGFDAYQGPDFEIADAQVMAWSLVAGDESALIVGRQDTVHLRAQSTRCVENVVLKDAAGHESRPEWRAVKADELEIKLPLQDFTPGELTLLVQQYGLAERQSVTLHAYAEASRLESFSVHAGDNVGVLRGNRLDEVEVLTVRDAEFTPEGLTTTDGHDELTMVAGAAHPATHLKAGDAGKARVALKDGRELDVRVSVEPPRPNATLIDMNAQAYTARGGLDIRLAGPNELPQDARVTFSLRAQAPGSFSHQERIEIATADGTSAILDAASGALTFENARVAVASFEPARALGLSAFGPLRYRLVSGDANGDWHPLATLVRLPVLKSFECPDNPDAPCTLSGTNLFLLDSVGADAEFSRAVRVPDGFPGQALQVPRPAASQLYLRLRDDPQLVSVAILEPHPGPKSEAARAPGGG
jgi:hypothetical protein